MLKGYGNNARQKLAISPQLIDSEWIQIQFSRESCSLKEALTIMHNQKGY
jgi:hypothetical protein